MGYYFRNEKGKKVRIEEDGGCLEMIIGIFIIGGFFYLIGSHGIHTEKPKKKLLPMKSITDSTFIVHKLYELLAVIIILFLLIAFRKKIGRLIKMLFRKILPRKKQ